MTFEIESLQSRQILDSRGNPTLECEAYLTGGAVGRAAVPSGASTGENEAVELRDGDKKIYLGKSVYDAVQHVQQDIAPQLIGQDARDQEGVDALMIAIDGTPSKSSLGANAILSVSMAVAKAAALATRAARSIAISAAAQPRFCRSPMLNILNGGKHADNTVDFQEFMIQPWGFDTFDVALRAGVEIYHTLRNVLNDKDMSTAVGDEGGFAPNLKDNEEALSLIAEAVDKAGYSLGEQILIALDPAASELVNEARKKDQDGYCFFKSEPERVASSDEMIDLWEDWCSLVPDLLDRRRAWRR